MVGVLCVFVCVHIMFWVDFILGYVLRFSVVLVFFS